jgi:hypothetical protein
MSREHRRKNCVGIGNQARRVRVTDVTRGRKRQQPRCPRAPRAGRARTWRRLMRAWLGPKPGSLSMGGQLNHRDTRPLRANDGPIARLLCAVRRMEGIGDAGFMDGSGEARRGVRRDPEPPAGEAIRTTRPLTSPLNGTLRHKQGSTVERRVFPAFLHSFGRGTFVSIRRFLLGRTPESKGR